jgi:hypothetical protein
LRAIGTGNLCARPDDTRQLPAGVERRLREVLGWRNRPNPIDIYMAIRDVLVEAEEEAQMDDPDAIRRAEAILRKHGDTPTTIIILRPPKGVPRQAEALVCPSLEAALRAARADPAPRSNVGIVIHDPGGDVWETDQQVVDALLSS